MKYQFLNIGHQLQTNQDGNRSIDNDELLNTEDLRGNNLTTKYSKVSGFTRLTKELELYVQLKIEYGAKGVVSVLML